MKNKSSLVIMLSVIAAALAVGCDIESGKETEQRSSFTSISEKDSQTFEESEHSEENSLSDEKTSESTAGIIDKIIDSLSFESIYDDYSKQIEAAASDCISEINANKGNIEMLADISAEGIDKMADLCAEGIDKMADRALLNASGYMEWSTKLTALYTDKSSEVTSAYMSASLEGVLGGFDFNFNF